MQGAERLSEGTLKNGKVFFFVQFIQRTNGKVFSTGDPRGGGSLKGQEYAVEEEIVWW